MSYIINNINISNIEIITSTRTGGFSSSPYLSNNMSYNVGDNANDVEKNRAQFLKETNILGYNLVVSKQRNTDVVLKINNITDDREGDSIYTANKDLALALIHSDHAPIFIYVKNSDIICAIHATRLNTLSLITEKTIQLLLKKEKCDVNDIHVFFGPGRSLSHTQLDEKLITKIKNLGYESSIKQVEDASYLDINEMNYLQLVKMGVAQDHITTSEFDTSKNTDLFFSQIEEGVTGRMISFIRFKN